MRATRSDSSYFRRAGRNTMRPSRSSARFTQSPSPRLACLAIASGIRTARLFPHFEIVDSFRMCIYFEYTSDLHAIRHGKPRSFYRALHELERLRVTSPVPDPSLTEGPPPPENDSA